MCLSELQSQSVMEGGGVGLAPCGSHHWVPQMPTMQRCCSCPCLAGRFSAGRLRACWREHGGPRRCVELGLEPNLPTSSPWLWAGIHIFFSQYLFVNLFGCTGLGCDMRDLVRWLGIEPGSPALSLSHWTPREVPGGCKFEHFLTLHQRAQWERSRQLRGHRAGDDHGSQGHPQDQREERTSEGLHRDPHGHGQHSRTRPQAPHTLKEKYHPKASPGQISRYLKKKKALFSSS